MNVFDVVAPPSPYLWMLSVVYMLVNVKGTSSFLERKNNNNNNDNNCHIIYYSYQFVIFQEGKRCFCCQ